MPDSPSTVLSLNVRMSYPDFRLDVQQDISMGGVTGLFGPSGGGKSTLLRIIAGLERSATGHVTFGGDVWMDNEERRFLPAHQRPVGYVFQDARLFQHLTVEGNLQFAAERCGRGDAAVDIGEIVEIFDLAALLQRRSDTLSGGERQRAAIARTLLTHPRLLLLDEPLAALDTGRKGEILPYLEALPARFDMPIVYVSHAIDEIARLADRVVVLDQGEVKAAGSVTDILNQFELLSPSSDSEVATILEARVIEQVPDLHLTRLDYRGQTMVVPELTQRAGGDSVRLFIRAGDVALATEKPEGISFRNVLAGTISAIDADDAGAFATVSVDIGGVQLRARLTRHAVDELNLKSGLPVYTLLKTASFDRGN